MGKISKKRLQDIKKRADAATDGPWEIEGKAVPWNAKQESPFVDQGAGICGVIVGGSQDEQGGAVGILKNEDAAFIANARQDIPDLLEEIAFLREAIDRACPLMAIFANNKDRYINKQWYKELEYWLAEYEEKGGGK